MDPRFIAVQHRQRGGSVGIPAPKLSLVDPETGSAGTEITLTGTHLDEDLQTLTINGIALEDVVQVDPSTITATIPAGVVVGAATITLWTEGGTTNISFEFVYAPGETATSIAHYDTVPYQLFDDTLTVGVVAFHVNGIQDVKFYVDTVLTDTVTSMTLNAETGVWEYWTELDATDYSDGPITVSAVVTPVLGIARTLADLPLYANSGATLTQTVKYVDSLLGNDTTGDGSSLTPYATIHKAAKAIMTANGGLADYGIVYLKAGAHHYGVDGVYGDAPTTQDTWLTIMPAPGETKATVSLSGADADGLLTKLIRLNDVTIDSDPIATGTAFVDYVWLDNSAFVGTGPGNGESAISGAASNWTGCYATDSTFEDCTNGFDHFKLVRGCSGSNIGAYAYSGTLAVIDCSVDGIDIPSGSGFHTDLWHWDSGDLDNVVIYGLTATNLLTSRGLAFTGDTGDELTNIAAVNVLIEKVEAVDSGINSVLGGDPTLPVLDNVLLWGVTIVGQRIYFASPVTGLSVRGCNFELAIGTVSDDSGFVSNHYVDNTTFGHIEPGTDVTTGDPEFEGAPDYHLAAGSPLLARLTLDVPVDIENTERDDPTGIGAYNGEVLGPVLLYQDSFDRADGDIDGSTLSGGTGTWDVITPDVTIATNRATTTLPSGSALAVVGDMTPVGDQRVSAKITNGIVEIVARYSVGGFYTVYPSSGAIHLYSSGTGGIGDSAAATFADGDTIDLECIGTTIKGYVNGVEVVSATNADHASGIAGVSPTNAAYANDFKVYA